MIAVGLVIKLGILYGLLKYLGSTGNVLKVSIIYAMSFLFLGFALNYENWSGPFFMVLLVWAIVDVTTGYIFFFMVDLYQDTFVSYFAVIIIGIFLSIVLRFYF